MKKAVNHRNMRILLVLIFSILSLAFCCYVNTAKKLVLAEPDYTPAITIDNKTVHRGQTFEISAYISGNQGLTGLKVALEYDNTVMTLKNVIREDALSSMTFTNTNNETDLGYSYIPFNLLWDAEVQDTSNGKLVTLVFDTDINAPLGDYEVKFILDTSNTKMDYGVPINVDITNGIVTLISGKFKAVYKDWDGRILYEKDYNDGGIPEYVGDLPEREEDAEYSYTFSHWEGAVSDNPDVLIYQASYHYEAKTYSLLFFIEGFNNFDGKITTEDLFSGYEIKFNEYFDYEEAPVKQLYIFYGWYLDEDFTQPCYLVKMPARNLRLYGYYKYDVREQNIPSVKLENTELTPTSATVVASLVRNTGFNAMVLTIDYDMSAMSLVSFERGSVLTEMQFGTTNIEKINEPGFKFIFEYSENSLEIGDFLILHFDILDSENAGIFPVTFTYDYHSDITYIDRYGEIKYSKIEIIDTEIPVGLIYHWSADVGNNRKIDVTSADGKPINVQLRVELVTADIDIDEQTISTVVGKKMYLQSAYRIELIQGNKIIAPQTMLTIKIKLTADERNCKVLKFYYYTDDKELQQVDFQIDGEYLVFNTDHLSEWCIFGDYNKNKGFESESKVVILVMQPILLAITAMIYAFVQKGKFTKLKNSNNKEAHDE